MGTWRTLQIRKIINMYLGIQYFLIISPLVKNCNEHILRTRSHPCYVTDRSASFRAYWNGNILGCFSCQKCLILSWVSPVLLLWNLQAADAQNIGRNLNLSSLFIIILNNLHPDGNYEFKVDRIFQSFLMKAHRWLSIYVTSIISVKNNYQLRC